jgi:hypothetical protein
MSPTDHAPFILGALKSISPERLQRAVLALAAGDMTVHLTRESEAEIRALVRNGSGKEYGVTLTANMTACSCPDALYRGTTCKHTIALALHVLRLPEPECAECGTTPAQMNDNARRLLCRECWEEVERQACRADKPGVSEPWPGEAPAFTYTYRVLPSINHQPDRTVHQLGEDGETLCGLPNPKRAWSYGNAPAGMGCWADACEPCEAIRRRPVRRPDLSLVKTSDGYGQRTAP